MFSVTCAVIWPGRSDRMPVISAADITAPPEGRSAILAQRRDRAQPSLRSAAAFRNAFCRSCAEGVAGGGRGQCSPNPAPARALGQLPQQRCAPGFPIGEETAGARGLDFLKAALLFRADAGIGRGRPGCGHRLSAILGTKDRPAEVTGKRDRAVARHCNLAAGQPVRQRSSGSRSNRVRRSADRRRGSEARGSAHLQPDAGDKTEAGGEPSATTG